MKLVVGSGPTGVAVATALLDAGQDVTLLDAGVDREAGVDQQLARFQTQAPEQWDRDWLAGIRSQPLASQGGVPEKRAFGSAHVYSLPDGPASISLDGVGCGPSFARGGFSNVWGAVTLPYRDADISEWPIDSSDLAADYAAVFEHLLPLAAVEDRLADLFPLHARAPAHLQMSAQAQAVLGDLEAGAAALAAAGVHFGRSRLAVESGTNRHGRNCVRCGLCMHGCPYELIYNARDSLVQLQGRPGFTYQPDFIVDTFTETAAGVTVSGRDRVSGEARVATGAALYLAAGAINTTRIVLESLGAYERPVRLLDSKYFLLPWLRRRAVRGYADPVNHTMCQLFMEIFDETVSTRGVHLQLYTYSDLFRAALDDALGVLRKPAAPLTPVLLSRLLVLQGYLHSDESDAMTLTLHRPGATPRLTLQGEQRRSVRDTVRRVVRKLWRIRGESGAIPLGPAIKTPPPGRGYHVGGSLPMRRTPRHELETDARGRLAGCERVFAADASVFPSIPATTITLTAMANAHRIGRLTANAT